MNSFVRSGALVGALGVTLLAANAGISRRSLQDHEIVIDKELLITSAEVVDSARAEYPGPWSFGHLLEEAFGEENAPGVVANWLEEWADGQGPTPGDKIGLPPRELLREKLIRPWQARDGYDPDGEASWTPKLENAPFRLLAIVNRMDLSVPLVSFNDPLPAPTRGAGYYNGSSGFDSGGGEGRFVFAATDQDGQPLEGGVTLILEYGLDIGSRQASLLDWAMAWHELGRHEEFNATYLAELAKVTRAFTDRRDEIPLATSPGAGSVRELDLHERLRRGPSSRAMQLLRIRTNDGVFGVPREFREFAWSAEGLTPAPLLGTPREVFFQKGTSENRFLARWLREQRGAEVVPTSARDQPGSEVPTSFSLPTYRVKGKSIPVVAHVAPVPGNDDSYHWDGWGLNDSEVRRAFSTQTCCGCHCGDTNTAFFHVAPRRAGEAAELSKFLRTDQSRWRAKDPGTKRSFLSAEMEVRKELFEAALNPDLRYGKIKAIKASRRGRGH